LKKILKNIKNIFCPKFIFSQFDTSSNVSFPQKNVALLSRSSKMARCRAQKKTNSIRFVLSLAMLGTNWLVNLHQDVKPIKHSQILFQAAGVSVLVDC